MIVEKSAQVFMRPDNDWSVQGCRSTCNPSLNIIPTASICRSILQIHDYLHPIAVHATPCWGELATAAATPKVVRSPIGFGVVESSDEDAWVGAALLGCGPLSNPLAFLP